jgi:CBS domain-containing protein
MSVAIAAGGLGAQRLKVRPDAAPTDGKVREASVAARPWPHERRRKVMKSLNAMAARDIMTSPVAYVMTETPLKDVATLLLERKISAAPVLDDAGRLAGIVSEGDLVRRTPAGEGGRRSWWLDLFEPDSPRSEGLFNYLREHGLRAKDVMTSEVVSVAEDTPAAEIAELLERRGIKRVPVVHNGKLAGIVSRANLLSLLARQMPPDRG